MWAHEILPGWQHIVLCGHRSSRQTSLGQTLTSEWISWLSVFARQGCDTDASDETLLFDLSQHMLKQNAFRSVIFVADLCSWAAETSGRSWFVAYLCKLMNSLCTKWYHSFQASYPQHAHPQHADTVKQPALTESVLIEKQFVMATLTARMDLMRMLVELIR